MSDAPSEDPSDAPFAALIVAVLARHGDTITPIGAGLLAAAHLGLAGDSRSFARKLDLAHALVLRDCVALAAEQGLLTLDDRGEPSGRKFFHLTPRGEQLLAGVAA